MAFVQIRRAAYLWVSSQTPLQHTGFTACALVGHLLLQILPRLHPAVLEVSAQRHQPGGAFFRLPSLSGCPTSTLFLSLPTHPTHLLQPSLSSIYLSICCLPPPVEWGLQDGEDLALFSAVLQSLAENRLIGDFPGG